MRLTGHVGRLREARGAYRFFVGKDERDHWEDLGADRIIVIKLIFKK